MKKLYTILTLVASLSLSSLTTAFGGQWIGDASGWKYQKDDASFHTNGWQWIDGKLSYEYYHSRWIHSGRKRRLDGKWCCTG